MQIVIAILLLVLIVVEFSDKVKTNSNYFIKWRSNTNSGYLFIENTDLGVEENQTLLHNSLIKLSKDPNVIIEGVSIV